MYSGERVQQDAGVCKRDYEIHTRFRIDTRRSFRAKYGLGTKDATKWKKSSYQADLAASRQIGRLLLSLAIFRYVHRKLSDDDTKASKNSKESARTRVISAVYVRANGFSSTGLF